MADGREARPPLVDSHAHLQSPDFEEDADDVLAAAREAGLARILVPAWNLRSSRSGLAFARAHGVADLGRHPPARRDRERRSRRGPRSGSSPALPEVAAIGETGLDFDRLFSPRDAQVTNLRRHLELALEVGQAAGPALSLGRGRSATRRTCSSPSCGTRAWGRAPGGPASGTDRLRVLHSFSGPVDYAEAALAMGLAVSFSGLVFRGGEEASAEVARLVPPERLLTETDSPFLKPRGVRGRRNEPRHVAVTTAWVAEQRQVDPAALGPVLVEAFDRFLGAEA